MSVNGKELLDMPVLPQSVIDFRRNQVEAIAGKVAEEILKDPKSLELMTMSFLVREVAERAVQASLYPNGYNQGVIYESNGHVEAITQ